MSAPPNRSSAAATPDRPPADTETIDVVSDVVCPWCYIGKKQLDAALASLPADRRPAVRWHPFELNPDLPRDGVDRRDYLDAKFGGPERAAAIYERVRQAGRAVGIAFDFDRIERQPCTLDAHRLIGWAQERDGGEGDIDALVEALFHAYFVEGRFIGDRAVLAAVAGECGYDAVAAGEMLAGDDGVAETADREEQARRAGVEGVPFFVFNRRIGVSGAQGEAALRDALGKSRGAAA